MRLERSTFSRDMDAVQHSRYTGINVFRVCLFSRNVPWLSSLSSLLEKSNLKGFSIPCSWHIFLESIKFLLFLWQTLFCPTPTNSISRSLTQTGKGSIEVNDTCCCGGRNSEVFCLLIRKYAMKILIIST